MGSLRDCFTAGSIFSGNDSTLGSGVAASLRNSSDSQQFTSCSAQALDPRCFDSLPRPAWGAPVLISLGLATSLAETLGITLIVAFVYVALGQTGDATAAVGGLLGQWLDRGLAVSGSPALMALGILLLILGRTSLAYANHAISAKISVTHQRGFAQPHSRGLSHSTLRLYSATRAGAPDGGAGLTNLEPLVADAYLSFTQLLIGGCSILVFGVFLVAVSWQITLTACAGSILMSIMIRRLSRSAQALGRQVKQVHQDLAEQMLMTIEGLRTIRAYGQERAHQDRFLRSSAAARQASLALTHLSALLDPMAQRGRVSRDPFWDHCRCNS